MWRLLDYDDLAIDMHKDIYKFVIDNWNEWLPYIVNKFGGKEKVFSSCQSRLRSPSFPKSKAWVYLCVATQCHKLNDMIYCSYRMPECASYDCA